MEPNFVQKNCGNGENQLPELILTLRNKLQETTEADDLDYLQNIRTDDEFLAKILRTREYNLERAYKSVLNYYKCIHHHYADIISDPNSTSAYVATIQNAKITQKLNISACKSNSNTLLINMGKWDTSQFTVYQLQQSAAFTYEELALQLEGQLNGCSILVNFQGLSLQHLRQLTPTELKRSVYKLQDGLPIRIIAFHVINYPAIFWGLYNFTKLFMKKKMINRIHFHRNLESLHEYFYKENLPSSLGGALEDNDLTEHNAMIKKFMTRTFHCKEYFTPKKNTSDDNDNLYERTSDIQDE